MNREEIVRPYRRLPGYAGGSAIQSSVAPCGSAQATGVLFCATRKWPRSGAASLRAAMSGKTCGASFAIQISHDALTERANASRADSGEM